MRDARRRVKGMHQLRDFIFTHSASCWLETHIGILIGSKIHSMDYLLKIKGSKWCIWMNLGAYVYPEHYKHRFGFTELSYLDLDIHMIEFKDE